ncbi:MAG: DUF2141 domain-containing protein [Pseudomonadota bacterium]
MTNTNVNSSLRWSLPLLGLSFLSAFPVLSAELTVAVTGIKSDTGEIGCALYGGADGFPLEPSKATEQWHDAQSAGVQCRFADLDPGAYAVAVSHDFNGNRQTDTNFLGIPKEPWGVSNNARPRFRAPSFDEAAVQLDQDAGHRIEVRVAK